jgi:hypothetical protein
LKALTLGGFEPNVCSEALSSCSVVPSLTERESPLIPNQAC